MVRYAPAFELPQNIGGQSNQRAKRSTCPVVRRYAQTMRTPYHPPVKRSLAIAGHKTSISLEPLFWDMLRAAAVGEGMAVARLVARIDAERIKADPAPGLAGAIRIWLVANEKGGGLAPAALAEELSSGQ